MHFPKKHERHAARRRSSRRQFLSTSGWIVRSKRSTSTSNDGVRHLLLRDAKVRRNCASLYAILCHFAVFFSHVMQSHRKFSHSFTCTNISRGCLQLGDAFGLSDRAVHPPVLKNSRRMSIFCERGRVRKASTDTSLTKNVRSSRVFECRWLDRAI